MPFIHYTRKITPVLCDFEKPNRETVTVREGNSWSGWFMSIGDQFCIYGQTPPTGNKLSVSHATSEVRPHLPPLPLSRFPNSPDRGPLKGVKTSTIVCTHDQACARAQCSPDRVKWRRPKRRAASSGRCGRPADL